MGVADIAGANAQVADHGEEVESDFVGWVARDATLQDGDDFVWEVGGCAGAVGDWRGLEAVEFVEGVVEGGVGYEVEDVVVFGGEVGGFVDEGGGAREGVVDGAD